MSMSTSALEHRQKHASWLQVFLSQTNYMRNMPRIPFPSNTPCWDNREHRQKHRGFGFFYPRRSIRGICVGFHFRPVPLVGITARAFRCVREESRFTPDPIELDYFVLMMPRYSRKLPRREFHETEFLARKVEPSGVWHRPMKHSEALLSVVLPRSSLSM